MTTPTSIDLSGRMKTDGINIAGYSKESLDLSETSVNVGTFVKGKSRLSQPIDSKEPSPVTSQ